MRMYDKDGVLLTPHRIGTTRAGHALYAYPGPDTTCHSDTGERLSVDRDGNIIVAMRRPRCKTDNVRSKGV
jgi:hypothetical protein